MMMNMFFLNSNVVFFLLFGILGLILLVLIASKVHEHATRNDIPMPLLWALLVITMPMLGLLIYLLVASTYSQSYQRQRETQPLLASTPVGTVNTSSVPSVTRTRINEPSAFPQSTSLSTSLTTKPTRIADTAPPTNESSVLKTQPSESRFCPRCGSLVGNADLFCSYCGFKLQ